MLNKALELEKLYHEYQINKRIIIPDFLEESMAEEVASGLEDLSERNLWYQANYGNPWYYNKSLSGKESIDKHFSYQYEKFPLKNNPLPEMLETDSRRTDLNNSKRFGNFPELELEQSHPLRKIGEILNSENLHNIISMITGQELSYSDVICSATRYRPGDFLAIHHDALEDPTFPRKVAFILHMTKNWLVHWGGNFVILDETSEKIIEDFCPKFNTMILFDVPLPHAVLPVSHYAGESRYAIAGWYQNVLIQNEKHEINLNRLSLDSCISSHPSLAKNY